jgi:hypothetical protein
MPPLAAATPPPVPSVILDTVLGGLALLFLTGAGGDLTAAREAARQMLAAYNPKTPAELTLAAGIIGFSFHALEALGQAADPQLSLNKVLRLRGSAVSLSRESHKSQRKLDQLQHARATQQPETVQASQAEPIPATEAAIRYEAEARAARTAGKLWLKEYHEREDAERIAKSPQPTSPQQDQAAPFTGAPPSIESARAAA